MKISIVILASGFSKRFGSNKLLYKIDNVTLIEKVFKSISMFHNEVVVVSTYEEIELLAKQYHYDYIKNNNPQNGISESVKLGTKHFINSDAILFMMGDQPFILKESIEKMFDEVNEKHILRASVKGKYLHQHVFQNVILTIYWKL